MTQAIPTSFKAEILQGIHDSADTYKIALYTSASTLGASTTAYTATNEISGVGYTSGGQTLSGFSVTTSGTTAILDFTTDPSWENATITARGALIYNASKANKAESKPWLIAPENDLPAPTVNGKSGAAILF